MTIQNDLLRITSARRGMWVMLLPALLAAIVHAPGLTGNLISDDVMLILRHGRIGDPRFLFEIFANDYGPEIGSPPAGYYRPFLVLMAFVLRQLFGTGGLVYHAAGLALLCCGAALVARLTLLAGGWRARVWALLAGCLYAAHPARVETGAVFTSLPDLLIELAALGLMCQMIRLGSAGGNRCWTRVAGFVLALLAGLSKEGGLILPVALAAVFVLTHGLRRTLERYHGEYGLFVCGGTALAWLCRWGAGIQGQYPAWLYLKTLVGTGSGDALAVLARAGRDLVVPAGVVIMEHAHWPASWFTTGAVLAMGGAFAMLLWRMIRRGRLVAALLCVWIGAGMALLMLTGVAKLPYAQRYVPVAPILAGGCLLGRACLRYLRNRLAGPEGWTLAKPLLAGLLAVYMLILAGLSAHAAFLFRDMERLMLDIAAKNPDMAFAQISLARLTFARGGDSDRVVQYARRALELAPDDVYARSVRVILAKVALSRGQFPLAIEELDRVAVDRPHDPEIPYLKAVALVNLQRWDEAHAALGLAMAESPAHPEFQRLQAYIRDNRGAKAAGADSPASPAAKTP